jgi:signal transduction histidine kinase
MSGPVGDDRVTDGRAPALAAEPVTGPGLNGTDAGSRGGSTNGRVPRAGRPSRRGLKNWRVRSRLLFLIAIPTLTALVFGGVRVASAVQSALAYQRAQERAVLTSDITQLAQRLETERDQTVYYIALGSGGRAGDLSPAAPAAAKSAAAHQYRVLQAFYRQTDQVIAQFRARLAQSRGSYSSATQPEVASALTALNALPYLRQASAKSKLYALGVVQQYADLIDNLIAVEDQAGQGTRNPALSQTAAVLGLVSGMKEQASEQRAILSAALLRGTLPQADTAAFNAARASQQSSQQAFDLSATAPQREQWNNTVSGSFVNLAASQEQQAEMLQAQGQLVGDPLTAGGFYDSMSNGINNQMGSVERTLAADILTQSNSLRRSAVISAIAVGLAVFTVLTLALIFTVIVGRSIARPLRRLQMGALEVARVRLPETVRRVSEQGTADLPPETERIDVDSTDEIGEVARAFDQVHREAVRLAGNEAALRGNVNAIFVNLSRRSQSLVQRQIRLIDDLEQGEQEPQRLANLFQLDHIATRMRRNSENLLVLAGHDVTQRRTQAVALVDVVRAAVSEIEQYQRVTLDVQPGISVRGPAVSDLVHLLSELVENATSFSAGQTPVTVSAHLLNSGGVLFDITDHGVGMTAEEMAHANWRLDNPPVVDVAVSRRMGLFVVAQLAAGHGIRVRLRPASVNGLTALVWLPDEVISHQTAASTPGPPGWPTIGQPDEHPVALPAPAQAPTPRFAPLRPELDDTAAFWVIGSDTGAAASPQASAAPEADSGSGDDDQAPDDGTPDAGTQDTGTVPSSAQEAEALPAHGGPLSGPAARAGTGPGSALHPGSPAMPSFGSQPGPEPPGVIAPPAVSAGQENHLPVFESVESDWFRRRGHGAADSAPAGTPAAGGWASPADKGWRAAEVANTPVSGGMTTAGLPTRVPKANLVPGSAGATVVPTQATPARSASQTRERLASFQQGIWEGRAAAREDQTSTSEDDSA